MTFLDRHTARVLATILVFVFTLWILWGLREFFFLLIVALFFACTVEPILAAIYRHTPSFISRRIATLITFPLVFLSSGLILTILGQIVVNQASQLIQQLPSLNSDPSRSPLLPLPGYLEPCREEIMRLGFQIAHDFSNLFIANISSAGFLVLAPVFGLYSLLKGSSWRNALVLCAARSGRAIWLAALLDDLHTLLSNCIRALFLHSLAVLLAYLAFYHLIELPFALLLATLAAILEVIPRLGWPSAALLSIFAGELLGGVRRFFLSIPVLATQRIFYRHALRPGAILLGLTAASLSAHSISLSTSEAVIDGSALTLKLRIPRYEVEHVPFTGLSSAFHFSGAQLNSSSCAPQDQEILCDLRFAFPSPPAEQLDAQITLARVTVPNHVHILRISRGPVTRQIVFDRTFEKERINFHEPGRMEVFWRAARMGFAQLLYQPVLLALLLILPRPLAYSAALAAAFLVVLPDRFYASPGFFELATAISLTYLACEHLLFRDASGKWLISAAIGLLEGATLAILARPTGSGAVAFGAGNLLATLTLSLGARYFARKIPPLIERYLYWAFAALGILWTIWVFFNRF
ncbi:MAG: AI-2E family transporter [Acidobacteriota bacterium]